MHSQKANPGNDFPSRRALRRRRGRTRLALSTLTVGALLLSGAGAGVALLTSAPGPDRNDQTLDVSLTAAHARPARASRPLPTRRPRPTRTRPAVTTTAPSTTTAVPTTTAKPTTAVPTTSAPTTTRPTAAPTTAAPTTAAPTTAAPTTVKPTTSTPTVSTTAPATSDPVFKGVTSRETWTGGSSSIFSKVTNNGSTVTGGIADSQAADGRALALTIPAGAGNGPGNAAEVDSTKSFLYGSFSSRVRTADCSTQPRTGAVTGIFTFGNNGRDADRDGITDNSELDVEILCARPDIVNLTIWTDYDENTNAQRRVSRVIDLKAGRILSTCFLTSFDGDCQKLSGAENTPATVPAVPGFDSSKSYHDYRIDWTADRVVFTASDDAGRDITLWDYRGPADRIPHTSSAYLVNLWHTNDWTPDGAPGATAAPTAPLTASVDSSTLTPLS